MSKTTLTSNEFFDFAWTVGKWRIHFMCFKEGWKWGVSISRKGIFSNVGPFLFDVWRNY